MDRDIERSREIGPVNCQAASGFPPMNAFCSIHPEQRMEYVSVDPAQDFVFKSPTTSEEVFAKISNFFKDLRAHLLHKLEKIERQLIEKYNSLSNFGQIIEQYNKISAKQDLKAIISDNTKQIQVKSSEIKAICQEALNKQEENNYLIRTALEKLQVIENPIDFEFSNLIKEQIYSKLNEINTFLVEDFQQSQDIVEQDATKRNQNISNLMRLVNNKLNGISDESCERLQVQLNKISFAFSSIVVPEVGSIGKYLESLNENSSEIVQKLVEDLANNQQSNELSDQSQKEYLIPGDLVRLVGNKTNFCSNEYIEDVTNVLKTLERVIGSFVVRKPRIKLEEFYAFNNLSEQELFDITELTIKSNRNKVEKTISKKQQLIFNPFVFIKTNYRNSQNIKITQNGESIQLSLNPSMTGQVVSDILNNEVGYRIKLQFTQPIAAAYNGFYIGLIQDSRIHSTHVLSNSHESGLCTLPNHGANIVLKGGKITSEQLSKVTDCVEFRFCISQGIFLYADRSYNNINQADQKYFDPMQQYRFGIFFYLNRSSEMQVEVSEFSEIDRFEVMNFC